VPSGLHYEPQAEKDTCFIHATNMYFQRAYINSQFFNLYNKLVNDASKTIETILHNNAEASFYGSKPAPSDPKLLKDTSSNAELNDDLYGYFEIYSKTVPQQLLEALSNNKCKELSPSQCLFLLEFQLEEKEENGKKVVSLYYAPHRFYHRYARNSDGNDQNYSKEQFLTVCEGVNVDVPIYLAHIEIGKAHAFGARKMKDSWILLDSLHKHVIPIKDQKKLFAEHDYAGRASVLMTADTNRPRKLLTHTEL